MYFQQFYLGCLAHASYMLGSGGEAAVVDPQRDVQIYLDEAQKQGLRITHIFETHMHADFVSGHIELARRTGAKIYVSAKAGAKFPHVGLKDGDEVRFGTCTLRALETPGHSIDSVCLVVVNRDAEGKGEQPWAVLTGDTLFIGEVGRPDLSPIYTPQQLADMLYTSLHDKLLTLPDHTLVYPAHGAGSLCGRNIGTARSSTIGQERSFNYALQPRSREEFIRIICADQPERPEYFFRDADLNRTGASPLTDLPPLPVLTPQEVLHKQEIGTIVLDTRSAAEFGAGHVPGSIHIGLAGQYASWAGILIGLDHPLILVAANEDQLQESRLRLTRVGMDHVVGCLGGPEGEAAGNGIMAWQCAGLPLGEVPQISVLDLFQALCDQPESIQVIDVRRPQEWEVGHIEQARNKPLDRLRTSLEDLDTSRPIAVHCKSGYRSSIATSLLLRAGFRQVMNVTGGFDAWMQQKLPHVAAQSAPACSD
ncbi:MAG TPA: rhodanese-like domain-containing protein [Candidatus Nitrosotenuis sp.]|nr:rhodanese-like domain-containing protein [Candidatus Nitrosotenuis sp.]